MTKRILLIALVAYLLSAGISYAAARAFLGGAQVALGPSPAEEVLEEDIEGLLLQIDPSEPRDQVCPLNGKYFTATEREAWEQRRPLAVMIENHPEARPQSGLSAADVTFEAIAEGGVTRFMPIFYCGAQIRDVVLAPVRSARTYFVDYASGFNYPLYAHVGGANVPGPTDALGQIADYGWVGENDLNQFSIGYPTFVRDYNRLGKNRQLATEHTMVSSTELLWNYAAEERGWTNLAPDYQITRSLEPGSDWQEGYTGWSFTDDEPGEASVTQITFSFWDNFGDYAVEWQYDAEANAYRRNMGGEAHLDLNTDEQIMVSNAVVLLTDETGPINEKKHMLYDTVGTGDALVFHSGQVFEVTWEKEDREAELQFFDEKGQEFEFARGPIWISVVDTSTEVDFN